LNDGDPSEPQLQIGSYDLDEDLLHEVRTRDCLQIQLYRYPGTAVVLGRGSKPSVELNLDSCINDGITIERRRGGGCSVVLDRGNLICSVAYPLPGLGGIHQSYDRVTGWLIDGLADCGIPGVKREGATDLALNGMKVGGGCIYRERGLLFYSTTILFDPDIDMIERYLLHPPREPDYRRDRSHRDFVTSLVNYSNMKDIEEFGQRLEDSLLLSAVTFHDAAQ
jgi:lipoate-protein ligase A